MEAEKFFKTKGGRFTVVFAAILATFALILTGLKMQGDGACLLGFIPLVTAMLYSPFKVYVLDRKKQEKAQVSFQKRIEGAY